MIASSLSLHWHGCELVLLPGRALWLPQTRALVIADWHLGKSQVFRRAGIPVPSGVTSADLGRLDTLLHTTQAVELIVLGDLLHGSVDTESDWLRSLQQWRASHPALRLRIAVGNHDRQLRKLPLAIDEIGASLSLGPLIGVHDVDPTDPRPQIAGHTHPVRRLRAAGRSERVPVAWLQPKALILPAFGRFTGGYVIEPGSGDRCYAVLDDAVIALP